MVIDEQQLIAECKQGKSLAQKKIYDLYAPMMMGVCVRYINNKEAARDVLQDGFIKLFTKINTYTGEGSFAAWARRVFITTALESLREHHALKFSVSIDDYKESFENNDESIIDKILEKDLISCIATLPEGYRAVFNLYAIEGYSHAEIATMLHITESTSRSQFLRARKVLQEKIQSIL